jgi:3-dehydroquinate dehydratase-2
VRAVSTPIIEIHITNIYTKESYRPRSLLSYVANGIICGFGFDTYRVGLQAVLHMTTTEG